MKSLENKFKTSKEALFHLGKENIPNLTFYITMGIIFICLFIFLEIIIENIIIEGKNSLATILIIEFVSLLVGLFGLAFFSKGVNLKKQKTIFIEDAHEFYLVDMGRIEINKHFGSIFNKRLLPIDSWEEFVNAKGGKYFFNGIEVDSIEKNKKDSFYQIIIEGRYQKNFIKFLCHLPESKFEEISKVLKITPLWVIVELDKDKNNILTNCGYAYEEEEGSQILNK